MSYKSLETKIIKLLPSETLREYVNKFKFRFTQKDLLKFIEDYSPLYDYKMKLLQEAVVCFSDKLVIKHAQKLMEYHKRTFDEFMTPNADCVYEVDIKCFPDDMNEETFIVKTFDDALIIINNYIKRYRDVGAKDNKLSEYTIMKKTTIAPNRPSDFSQKVGTIGKCVLGYKCVIKSVEMYYNGNYWGKCNNLCYDCKNSCIENHAPHFPNFLQQYDLVACKKSRSYSQRVIDGKIYQCVNCGEYIVYGILVTDINRYDDGTEVVLLDNEYIRDRNAFARYDEGYYHIYDAHAHPSYAELFKPDLSEINKDILEDYEYAVEALKKIEEQK